MVLQHAHSFPRASSDASGLRLDPARILAGAGAIALNVVALLLLLIPAGLPSVTAPRVDKGITVVDIVERIKPPAPPPPRPVEVVSPRTPAAPQVPVKPDRARPVSDQVVVDQGTLPADPVVSPAINAGPADIAPTSAPPHGMQLEYAQAPSPPYPREAVMAGMQGTVLLRVLVDVDGRPLRVEVERSSGHRVLDEAARRFVLKRWSFRPAMQGGRAVQAIGLVPIDYRLD